MDVDPPGEAAYSAVAMTRCEPGPGSRAADTRSREERTIRLAPVTALLGPEPSEGQLQHVRAAARAVIGGDGVAADQQREEEHAAGLDVVCVGAEGAEQRAQVAHPPVVDAAEALGHRRIAPGPVADREVGRQNAGGGEREQ